MKLVRKTLAGSVVSMALAFSLAACSGGGSSLPSASNAAAAGAPAASGANGSTIGAISKTILSSASGGHVNTAAGRIGSTVDPGDTATVKVADGAALAPFAAKATLAAAHVMPLTTPRGGVSAHGRGVKAVAINSPLDLNYFGGTVLGSAVSHDIFPNCDASCRSTQLLNPGQFLSDLGKDEFSLLAAQYFLSPGEVISNPLTGRFTKGSGVDLQWHFSKAPAGFTNPMASQSDIINILVLSAVQTGVLDPNTGNLDRSQNHIFHLFLPPNVDTCVGTQCYSPDNPGAFTFCAYHSALQGQAADGTPEYLYFTIEPNADVPGCRPPTNLTLPNQVGSNRRTDAQDSTLSHELFETITDPLGDAWFNLNVNAEIGDLCAYYDNFVTVGGHKYVLQSEYSDIGHVCVSANLTNPGNVAIPGSATGGGGGD